MFNSRTFILVVYSIYSGILFGKLCAPSEDLSASNRWEPDATIPCFGNEITKDDWFEFMKSAAYACWICLFIFLLLYIAREVMKVRRYT